MAAAPAATATTADFLSSALNLMTQSLRARLAGALLGRLYWRQQEALRRAFQQLKLRGELAQLQQKLDDARHRADQEVRRVKECVRACALACEKRLGCSCE